jgi:Arc/MetJ-type ribon-helix-helix transcriptional regulator
METDKITVTIGTRITKTMKTDLDKLLATDGHLNTADYVRDLIRKDLERRGLLEEVRI